MGLFGKIKQGVTGKEYIDNFYYGKLNRTNDSNKFELYINLFYIYSTIL